jgi:hypothetical protein
VQKFLEIFDEKDFMGNFLTRINLLLSFGDYTQDDGSLTNLMTSSNIRDFLTTPSFNKSQFKTKNTADRIGLFRLFYHQQ